MISAERQVEFVGPFAQSAKAFIEHKRAMGYRYSSEEQMMRRFCSRYADAPSGALSKEVVMSWCARTQTEGIMTHRVRKRVIRQFGMYLDMMGIAAYIVPKQTGKMTIPAYIPYIYSRDEVSQIMTATDKLVSGTHAHRRYVYPLLMRMLYSCGLRISEALALRISDVDTSQGTILLRGAKFGKDRQVPMSASMTALVTEYMQRSLWVCSNDAYLFPAPDMGKYHPRTVYDFFRRVLQRCGIPHMGKGKGPRLHDFRHTFAVHSLNRWVDNGGDLYTVLPVLAAYLGHESILMTQKYLRLTPEVYPSIAQMVERACCGVIPEAVQL